MLATESYVDPRRWTGLQFRELLLLLLAIVCIGLRVWCTYERASSPFQADYEEGNILNAALRIVDGQTPYPTPGSFPYVLNCYGPIGYLLTAFAVKQFGLSFFAPRLLVLLAGLGIGCAIAFITKGVASDWVSGLLAAVCFLCAPVVYFWLPTLRVDFWAICLTLWGLYVFTNSPRAWFLSGVIFGAALLTKHTAVAAPAAVVVELMLRKAYREAMLLASVSGGIVVMCMLALGRNFIFALLGAHPDPFSLKLAIQSYAMAGYGCMLLIAVIIYALLRGSSLQGESRLFWVYGGLCTITMLSSGKLGSNTNHLLEWTAAICILLGLALSHLFVTKDLLGSAFASAVLLLSLLFAGVSIRDWRNIVADQSGCAAAYNFVKHFKGDRILAENISTVLLSGKPVAVSNPFVETQLGTSLQWQAGSLEELTSRHYFDLVLLGGDLSSFRPESGTWSPGFIHIVSREYVPVRYFQCPSARVAFVPNSGQPGAGE